MQNSENCGLPMVAVLMESFIFGLPASWGLAYISGLLQCPPPGYLATVGLLVFCKGVIMEGRRVWG
jgi:hypothetical protein